MTPCIGGAYRGAPRTFADEFVGASVSPRASGTVVRLPTLRSAAAQKTAGVAADGGVGGGIGEVPEKIEGLEAGEDSDEMATHAGVGFFREAVLEEGDDVGFEPEAQLPGRPDALARSRGAEEFAELAAGAVARVVERLERGLQGGARTGMLVGRAVFRLRRVE